MAVVAEVDEVDVEPDEATLDPEASVVEVVAVVADVAEADDAAVVAWCVPLLLAIHPVRTAAPATLSRPVAYRARLAGCGRRRRR